MSQSIQEQGSTPEQQLSNAMQDATISENNVSPDSKILVKNKKILKTFEALLSKDIQIRLNQGQGETHYSINDDAWNNFLEQAEDKLEYSQFCAKSMINFEKAQDFFIKNLCEEKLKLKVQVLRNFSENYKKIDLLLRKSIGDKDFIEVRVAVIGNVDAGKSTVLGVLTHAELDNGRGFARQKLFRHRHELETGRTSAVGSEILGFSDDGQIVNKASHQSAQHPLSATALNNLWQRICRDSSKVINFIDLAGHEKYLKTTVFGMTGHLPDFCMLIVGSNQGVVGMSKEHLGLALNLNVPVFIVVTKIDMCPANILDNTMKTLKRIMKAPSVRKMPLDVKTQDDVVMAAHHITERICPIFQISNVTGQNLDLLKSFLNMLTSRSSSLKNAVGQFQNKTGNPDSVVEQALNSLNNENLQDLADNELNTDDSKVEILLDDSFSVGGVGTVVSGTVLSGVLRQNTTLMFGPDKLGKFVPVDVRTLQRRRLPVEEASPGQTVAAAIRKLKRRDVRKGQVLISKNALEDYRINDENNVNSKTVMYAPWEFYADVVILHHPTTISLKYQAMLHIGSIRQTGVIKWMDKDHLRTGDKARVMFQFMKNPEFVREGQKFVFREGRTKAVGIIVQRRSTYTGGMPKESESGHSINEWGQGTSKTGTRTGGARARNKAATGSMGKTIAAQN